MTIPVIAADQVAATRMQTVAFSRAMCIADLRGELSWMGEEIGGYSDGGRVQVFGTASRSRA